MRKKLMECFDGSRKRVAILQNAFEVNETIKLNDVAELKFRMPVIDEKNRYCTARNYVRFDHGAMYRIADHTTTKEDTGVVEYTCEHAIATLADRLLFKDHILEGLQTAEVIRYILQGQDNWMLGTCDFAFQYDYSWTSENLLSALMSVATPFTEPYKFEFQTNVYPWRIHLRRLDADGKPSYYVFEKFNLIRSEKTAKSTQVATRLYCQGYGEGINQLGIESVHPKGLPYIQSPPEIVAKYGIVEAHFVDRSYEDAQALYDAGAALLARMQEPREEFEVDVVDLEGVSSNNYMKADVGETIYFPKDRYRTFITEIERNHDVSGDIKLKIANTPDDLVKSLADIADRQRIEATYSQGATQLWGSPLQANATSSNALVYPLWIPDATRVINSVRVKIKLSKFQAYSKDTSAGGGSTQTSGGGGGGTVTSEGGGGDVISDPAKITTTSAYTGNPLDSENRAKNNTDGVTPKQSDNYYHYHGMVHNHNVVVRVTIPSISFPLPVHTHRVSTSSHTHSVNIPSHTHGIAYGIFLAPETPASATVKINGKEAFTMGTEFEGDITRYLIGDNGEIPRGRFLDIAVQPNTYAFITISVAAQGFIQSRGGGKY